MTQPLVQVAQDARMVSMLVPSVEPFEPSVTVELSVGQTRKLAQELWKQAYVAEANEQRARAREHGPTPIVRRPPR